MADKTISQITGTLEAPEDGYYLEVDHTSSGTKKMLVTKLSSTDGWSEPNGGLILNGVDQYLILQDQAGVQAIAIEVNELSISETVELAYLGTNLEIDAISGTVTLGSAFANATIYIDNVATATLTATSKLILVTFDAVSVSGGYLGYDGTNFGAYHLVDFGLWNMQPDSDLRSDIWNNGQPNLASTDYKYQGASNTEMITNGDFSAVKAGVYDNDPDGWDVDGEVDVDNRVTANGTNIVLKSSGGNVSFWQECGLKIGKKYRLTGSFTCISGSLRITDWSDIARYGLLQVTDTSYSLDFIANFSSIKINRQTACEWAIDNISIVQIGEVLNLPYNKMGTNGAIDISGNESHANTVGSPIALSGLRDYHSITSATYTMANTIKAGHLLEYVNIKNNDSSAITVSLGTTASGTDVLNAESIAGGGTEVLLPLPKHFSDSVITTLYFSNTGVSNYQVQFLNKEI